MKNLLLTSMLAFLLVQCTEKKAMPDIQAEQDALRQADIAWAEAAKTTEGHLEYFLEDAMVLGPNEPVMMGKKNIQEMLAGLHSTPGFMLHWQPISVEVASSGDLGYTVGSYSFAMTDSAGNPINDNGKYLTIWKKQPDGSWKVAADMFNSDLAMQ